MPNNYSRMKNPDDLVLDELDRAILAALPDEGAKFGKYLPDAVSVKKLRPIVDPVVSPGTYGARLGMMKDAGYVVTVQRAGRTAGDGLSWQRTAKGKAEVT